MRCQFCGAELSDQCEHPDTLTCIRALRGDMDRLDGQLARLAGLLATDDCGRVSGLYAQSETVRLLREVG